MKCKQYNIIAAFIFMLSFLCLFPQKVSAQQINSNNTQLNVQPQASIRLNKVGSVVERGDKIKLRVNISNSRSKKIIWTSSKKSVTDRLPQKIKVLQLLRQGLPEQAFVHKVLLLLRIT